MANESDKAKPVSLRKAPAESGAAATSRPRSVTAAAAAIALSGLAAVLAAVTLFGERAWLTKDTRDANAKAVRTAVSSAVADAKHKHAGQDAIAKASASASSSATKKYPTGGSALHDHVTQQQTGALTMSLFLSLALAFVGYGVFRGRHWSRWGTIALWVLSSFTGTFAGITYVVLIGSTGLPGAFRACAFVSALSLLVAVFFVNMRQSTAYFAAHRPVPGEGGARRRGMFAPRTPPPARRPIKPAGTQPVDDESAAQSSVQRQRAKKRANAEAVARGAELARNRAKAASKSRRTES